MNKAVAEFSSGMQQRLKLILCCSFEAKVLLLDEPTAHLDSKGIAWYKDLLKRTMDEKITLIASNDPAEYNDFAKKIINIETK
jgi:ABC-type multidrug transport system ATPase subunit